MIYDDVAENVGDEVTVIEEERSDYNYMEVREEIEKSFAVKENIAYGREKNFVLKKNAAYGEGKNFALNKNVAYVTHS